MGLLIQSRGMVQPEEMSIRVWSIPKRLCCFRWYDTRVWELRVEVERRSGIRREIVSSSFDLNVWTSMERDCSSLCSSPPIKDLLTGATIVDFTFLNEDQLLCQSIWLKEHTFPRKTRAGVVYILNSRQAGSYFGYLLPLINLGILAFNVSRYHWAYSDDVRFIILCFSEGIIGRLYLNNHINVADNGRKGCGC